jgi:hypothetical protein
VLTGELAAPVRAANGLTERWAGGWRGGSTVLSGAGVWPLLAALAGGASGSTLAELSAAVGVPGDEALAAARRLWEVLAASSDVRVALGLWRRAELALDAGWAGALPAGVHGELTGDAAADQERLDAWVVEQTGGLLTRMPVALTWDTVLVLASALTVRTRWVEPFEDVPLWAGSGPWQGLGELAGLTRTGDDLNAVAVENTAAGPLTTVVVRGAGDVDVHLLLGEDDRSPGAVLSAGLAALPAGPAPDHGTSSSGGPASGGRAALGGGAVGWGSELAVGAVGPGLRVVERPSASGEPGVVVRCVRFAVAGKHDLLARAELFGLRAASDAGTASFPGVSPTPLMVSRARQDATATFSATGFEAAAVTSMRMRPTSMPANTARTVEVTVDRPFGFAAVHRPSGLVLVAGWVAEPTTPAG